MKKLTIYAVFFGLLAFFVFAYKTEIISLFYYSPCSSPINYKIGSVDQRFNLSEAKFLADVQEATSIWGGINGKPLFVYNPQGDLTISMIFDERQSLTNQIGALDKQLQTEKNAISPELQKYQALAQDFKTRLSSLNTQIDYWNSQGGAPPDTYKKLIDEQNALQQEATTLNQMAKSLNQSTDIYNAQVGQLNQTVSNFNEVIQVKPEEGLYSSADNTISIYFNNNHNELIHTLAHELGHALGLQHVNYPNSVMYPQTNNIISPSSDDLAAYHKLCDKKLIFNVLYERLSALTKQNQ